MNTPLNLPDEGELPAVITVALQNTDFGEESEFRFDHSLSSSRVLEGGCETTFAVKPGLAKIRISEGRISSSWKEFEFKSGIRYSILLKFPKSHTAYRMLFNSIIGSRSAFDLEVQEMGRAF